MRVMVEHIKRFFPNMFTRKKFINPTPFHPVNNYLPIFKKLLKFVYVSDLYSVQQNVVITPLPSVTLMILLSGTLSHLLLFSIDQM